MTEFYYYGLNNSLPRSFDPNETTVKAYYPVPTKREYEEGRMMRYFVRQANHSVGEITEVAKTTYDRLRTNPFFKTVAVIWRISGDLDDVPGPRNVNTPTRLYTGVITANRLALELANEEMPGMINQITNLTQFYKAE